MMTSGKVPVEEDKRSGKHGMYKFNMGRNSGLSGDQRRKTLRPGRGRYVQRRKSPGSDVRQTWSLKCELRLVFSIGPPAFVTRFLPSRLPVCPLLSQGPLHYFDGVVRTVRTGT